MASLTPFDRSNLLASTTGWNNNCSFHCLVHFLSREMEQATTANDIKKLADTPGYPQILKLFSEYYDIKPEMSIESLKKLLKEYPNPIDREIILGPVLRQYLIAELRKDWESGNPAKENNKKIISNLNKDIEIYLTTRERFEQSKGLSGSDQKFRMDLSLLWHPDLFNANWKNFSELYEKYQKQKATNPALTIEEFVEDQAQARDLLTKQNGFENYLKYLSENDTLISVEELDLLAKRMNIGLEVRVHREKRVVGSDGKSRTESSAEIEEGYSGSKTSDPARRLQVYHKGNHWQFIAANASVAQNHNLVYKNLERIQEKFEETAEDDQGQIARNTAIREQVKLNPKFLNIHLPTEVGEKQEMITAIKRNVKEAALRIYAASIAPATFMEASTSSAPATSEAPEITAEPLSRQATPAESKSSAEIEAAAESERAAEPKKPRKKSVQFRDKVESVESDAVIPPKPSSGEPKKSILKKRSTSEEAVPSSREATSSIEATSTSVEASPIIEASARVETTPSIEPTPEFEADVELEADAGEEIVQHPETPDQNTEQPASMPYKGMYSAHQANAVKEFLKPSDAELKARADTKEKVEASYRWLETQIKEGNQKRRLDNPHPFENVRMAKGSTKEKTTLLIDRSDGKQPDTITRTIDATNKVSVRLSHNSEDHAFVVLALSNSHFAPLIMQKNNDPKKVLKTMEAFLHVGLPLNIGENKQYFEATDCPKELKAMYILLSERDGEEFKAQLAALTPTERETRRFGEPLKRMDVSEKNRDTFAPRNL